MKIYSIVVTFNGINWIDRCIQSLVNSTIPVSIIVIDNASKDDTIKVMLQKYPKIEVIKSDENLGFGKANNIGLQKVLDEEADYAFLLNQDAWIEPDTISKLISIHGRNNDYGVLSPLQLSGDKINLDNAFTNYLNGYSCPNIISDYFFLRDRKDVYETKFVNAALWLISKECIKKVGGFDPLFFQYGEDEDYLARAKYHGIKVGICPEAIGYHDREQALINTTDWSPERIYSSRMIKLKNLSLTLPSKKHFLRSILKLKLSSFFGYKENHKLTLVNKLIIDKYDQIIISKTICKQPGPSFLYE